MPLEFDLASLRRATGGGSYVRGAEYARLGAVVQTAWDPEDHALRGIVRGHGASVYQALGCSNTTGCGANSLDSNTAGYTLSAQYNFSKSTNAIMSYRNWAFNVNAVDRDSEFELALVKNF